MTLIPTPIITLQLLSLLFATAIEAYVFFRRLHFPPQRSVQYALMINLVSTTAIWIVGLILQAVLPPQLKLYVMGYVFFGTAYTFEQDWRIQTTSLLILLSLIFWFLCLIEFKGIDMLEAILEESNETEPVTTDEEKDAQLEAEPKLDLGQRIYQALLENDQERLSTIFIANLFSNSIILLIILVIFVQRYR
ncbi:MAG: filament integrity protein FraC [Spirulinaceae cyanobacterium]